MHDFSQSKWFAGLAARNDPERIRLRLTLRFSLLYFIMFIMGLLLCRYTFVGRLPALRAQSEALFADPFAECMLARDYVRTILRAARKEMILLAALAASGMTYVSRTASDAVLTAHALLFAGIGCHALEGLLSGAIPHPHANLAFFLYFFAQLAQAAILLATAVEAVYFSYEYRDAGRALRTRRDGIAAQFAWHMASYAGMLLIAQTAEAVRLTLFEK